MSQSDTPSTFLGRWSRLKQRSRHEEETSPQLPESTELTEQPENTQAADTVDHEVPLHTAAPGTATLPPSLADVDDLTFQSDYQPFLKAGVTPEVKNAAMKKLFFSDPHFNLMDGLDVYIEDYNATHQPLPLSIIKKLASSKALSLFSTDPDEQDAAADTPPTDSATASPLLAAEDPTLSVQAPVPATPDPANSSLSTPASADTDQPDSSPKRV